jgi:hypothetical protein
MRSEIEQGRFIAWTARGEHGAPIFPSINMVLFAHSSKGKEKADPDDDRLLKFKPERHMSAKEVARNRRSRPNSGVLTGLHARPEHQYD